MKFSYPFSTLALAILSLLKESHHYGDGSMHAYQMQKLIHERGKDTVINTKQRASFYRTLDRLAKVGLVTITGTRTDANRPEKTLYAITNLGQTTWQMWMQTSLTHPKYDYPAFPAALTFLPLLSVSEALQYFGQRQQHLAGQQSQLRTELEQYSKQVDPLFLIESQYALSQLNAELTWVTHVIGQLQKGHLHWNTATLQTLINKQEKKS